MYTQTEKLRTNRCFGSGADGSEEIGLVTSREKWLQEYASRILSHFLRWQTPLGVAPAYISKVKNDLAEFYDDPLKRVFIEASY